MWKAAKDGFVGAIRLGAMLWVFVLMLPVYLLGVVAGLVWRAFVVGFDSCDGALEWVTDSKSGIAIEWKFNFKEREEGRSTAASDSSDGIATSGNEHGGEIHAGDGTGSDSGRSSGAHGAPDRERGEQRLGADGPSSAEAATIWPFEACQCAKCRAARPTPEAKEGECRPE